MYARKRSPWKSILIALMIMLFLSGLALMMYPYIHGAIVDREIALNAEEFLSWVEILPFIKPTDPDGTMETVPQEDIVPEETESERLYPDLWEDMVAYNESIYAQGQSGLSCEYDYQKPSFLLRSYGLEDETFGVISIPAMELEMPIFLGATDSHMAEGAAHLSQTSLPIGGPNTNCVIAGHRGYSGASYFRYIEKLQVGDYVTITNLWETLTYRVVEIKIINPYEVEQILIQPGRELLTLLTCHPYASGGRQRYLVFCERVVDTPNGV